MQAYRLETVVSQQGEVRLKQLPFRPGERVEVIILARRSRKGTKSSFPLKNTVLKFIDPIEPVAETDWAVLQ
jgi:hypothetical protein